MNKQKANKQIGKSANEQKGRWSNWLEGTDVDDREIVAGIIIAFIAFVYMALKYGPSILRVLGGE